MRGWASPAHAAGRLPDAAGCTRKAGGPGRRRHCVGRGTFRRPRPPHACRGVRSLTGRRRLHDAQRQLTLEPFLAFRKRFAKIQSKRLKQAVRGITGKPNPTIELHGGEPDSRPLPGSGAADPAHHSTVTEPAAGGAVGARRRGPKRSVAAAGGAKRQRAAAARDGGDGAVAAGKGGNAAGKRGNGPAEPAHAPAGDEPADGRRRSQRRKAAHAPGA